jgi:hypothetical protein
MSYNKMWQRKDISTAVVLAACTCSRRPIDLIVSFLCCPEKVVVSAFEREESKGLIECGVSLYTAWPTEKGLEYMESE